VKRIRHSKLMRNRNYTVIDLALYVLAGLPCFSLVQAGQLPRLTDFGLPKSSNPTRLVDVNGRLFFFVPTDSGNRTELWRSDGTAAGTVLVKKELPPARDRDADLFKANAWRA
jgi:ELWxxDGT repeat protein